MDAYTVKDLMVPLSEYATVPESASLYEAILSLEKAQTEFDHTKYRHRAVLVLAPNGRVIGKLSQLDVLRAMQSLVDVTAKDVFRIRRYGFSQGFIRRLHQQGRGAIPPLADLCRRLIRFKARDFMQTPTEGEFVGLTASLGTAIHQLVMGNHLSLLVTDGPERILGILRLTDVFAALFHLMKDCELESSQIAS